MKFIVPNCGPNAESYAGCKDASESGQLLLCCEDAQQPLLPVSQGSQPSSLPHDQEKQAWNAQKKVNWSGSCRLVGPFRRIISNPDWSFLSQMDGIRIVIVLLGHFSVVLFDITSSLNQLPVEKILKMFPKEGTLEKFNRTHWWAALKPSPQ